MPIRIRLLLVALLLSSRLGAQQEAASAAAIRLSGTVYDSVAGAPLEGATVQLVSADRQRDLVRSAITTATGGFELRDIPAGRYSLGFLHPVLDALGLEAPAREVTVSSDGPLRVDLAIPSPERINATLCRDAPRASSAVLMGVVRRASDRLSVPGAIVEGAWTEYAIGRGTVGHRVARAVDTTGADGRFVLCGMPKGGTTVVRVLSGTDSTALIDAEIPPNGFSWRDLYIGRGWKGTAAGIDSMRSRVDVGDGALHGRVLDGKTARPIAAARVSIVGGSEVRTNAAGEWALVGIPSGSRSLEVRAVGYLPARIPADVYASAPAMEVRLAAVAAVLDTIRVNASRERLQGTGFDERARQGLGRYLTASDLARWPLVVTSEVFRTVPGMYLERTTGGNILQMRGTFTERCNPNVYIDGHLMRARSDADTLSADDVDAFVRPDEVAGIEVYSGTFVPAEFNPGMTGCGSVVIWRKAGENPARRWSWRRRALQAAGVGGFGLVVGVLMTRF